MTGHLNRIARDGRVMVLYLLVLLVMTILMVTIGGITRHTDSGLSITDWRLLASPFPPTTATEWQELFDRYRQTPEYRLQNMHMQLADFRQIYWWEWIHRQAGRMIGLVWLAGLAILLATGSMTWVRLVRTLGLGMLGLIQGLLGWWMVQSGLEGNMVDVASYRLAIHLLMAFLIIALTFWFLLQEFGRPGRGTVARWPLTGFIMLLFVQCGLGALVAGIDAGAAYPTWPLMNGSLVPDMRLLEGPFWASSLENPALVHFLHRIVGYCIVGWAILIWIRNRATSGVMHLIGGLAVFQVVLGVATVLTAVNPVIALAHQSLAILMLLAAVAGINPRSGIFSQPFHGEQG